MVDFTKPVQCVDGTKARVLCLDRGDSQKQSIVALLGDDEYVAFYDADGISPFNPGLTLINVPTVAYVYLLYIPEKQAAIRLFTRDMAMKEAENYDGSLVFRLSMKGPDTIAVELAS